MEDCGSSIAAFCTQLRSYCLQLEASCAALRASVNHPPSSLPSPNLASLLTTLIDRVSSTGEAVGILESKTTDTISFQELLGHSMEIYKQNEANISVLEERLKEYGYTPDVSMAIDESTKPIKSFVLSELSSDLVGLEPAASKLSLDREAITPVSGIKRPLSGFDKVPYRLESCMHDEVKEEGQYGTFYPGALSLQELGLSAATLACLAEEDSSPGVDYITSSKNSGADPTSKGNAVSLSSAGALVTDVEEYHTEENQPPNDVPFFKPVEEYEYLSCPTWLKMQISFEDLNSIVDGMYNVLANKDTDGHAHSTLTQEDMEVVNAGTKMKPCLLLLVKLGRLRTGYENGATVYHVLYQ